MTWQIREGSGADARACFDVYVDAIRNGTAGRYTPEQARAWAPDTDDGGWLAARLDGSRSWVAVSDTGVEGFLSVTLSGHLDLFFVRPTARESGLARLLHDHLMDWARARGLNRLSTDASHLARSFLEKRGWRVLAGESVLRHGVMLERWQMEWQRKE